MKTFKQLTESANYHYSAYQLVNDKPKNRENLNHDELPEFMDKVHGKWATIMIVRNDGNAVTYTDDGRKFVVSKKEKLGKGSKLAP